MVPWFDVGHCEPFWLDISTVGSLNIVYVASCVCTLTMGGERE